MMSACALSCHEDPPPPHGDGPRLPPEQQGEQNGGQNGGKNDEQPAARTPEQLQAEIDALAAQDTIAAALRHDALLQLQAGKAEAEILEIHFFYSGDIERAERDFPGHLFAGIGDYLSAFERGVAEDLGKLTGLETRVYQTTISEMRLATQPCVTIAYGANELLTVDTPEGERPSLNFALSLMASFIHDPAKAPKREIEFFGSPGDHEWKEGENIGRVIYEQPALRARTTVSEWLGEIQPTTPR